jgi:hypothetical protein
MAKQIFHSEAHLAYVPNVFTLPTRDLFRWKKHLPKQVLFSWVCPTILNLAINQAESP